MGFRAVAQNKAGMLDLISTRRFFLLRYPNVYFIALYLKKSCLFESRMRFQTLSYTTFNLNGKRPLQGPNPFAKRFLYTASGGLDDEVKVARPTM